MNEIIITTGSKTHRFGPLVWRTSKERRKAKHQRRDKCNSGDSGIHVELENDELLLGAGEGNANASTTAEARNVHVRRTNSAKTSKSAAMNKKAQDQMTDADSANGSTLDRSVKGRSLSQPSDLNHMPHDTDSDTVSEGESHIELFTADRCEPSL